MLLNASLCPQPWAHHPRQMEVALVPPLSNVAASLPGGLTPCLVSFLASGRSDPVCQGCVQKTARCHAEESEPGSPPLWRNIERRNEGKTEPRFSKDVKSFVGLPFCGVSEVHLRLGISALDNVTADSNERSPVTSNLPSYSWGNWGPEGELSGPRSQAPQCNRTQVSWTPKPRFLHHMIERETEGPTERSPERKRKGDPYGCFSQAYSLGLTSLFPPTRGARLLTMYSSDMILHKKLGREYF